MYNSPFFLKFLNVPYTISCLSVLPRMTPKIRTSQVALLRETSLVAVTEHHHAIRSEKPSMVLILPDLLTAFNTVNHRTLLSILLELVSQHSLLLTWRDSHIR